MPTVLPTTTCFDDALDFIVEVLKANPEDARELATTLRLVHSVCLAPDGERFAHAWVEDGDRCIFCGILEGERTSLAAEREEYYAHWQVQTTTVYSVQEALQHNGRSGHYGPWLPEYRALCRDAGQVSL